MIDRRKMLAGSALFAAAPFGARAALPVPPGDRIGFDVMRKGSRLGTHVLTFTRGADGPVVHVAIDLVYKVMGVTLYRYAHRTVETWAGDRIVAFQTTGDNNGQKFAVTGRRVPDGIVVEGTTVPRYVAPADAMPATHWNRRELDGPLIDTQSGKLARPAVTAGGIDTIPAAGGRSLSGRHFALSGAVDLDIWYDDRLGWVGLSLTKGGAPVRYERQA